MNNTRFKDFKTLALKDINDVGYMAYAWLDLTAKQMNAMCDMATEQGLPYDGQWYTLSNGMRFKRPVD